MHFAAEGGEPVHAPLVLATIGAFHTRLILDTGSDVHLLTAELADAAGLTLSTVDTGSDHANTSMQSWLVGDVSISLDEAQPEGSIALHDVIAIPAPEAFTRHGIGGALSPQRLHDSAFAVIDQVADELLVVECDPRSMREWLIARRPSPGVLVLERRGGSDIPIVQAAIEPFQPVPVLINTGGRHTELEPAAVPGLEAGAAERIGTGVSGAAVMGSTAGPQVLRIGELGEHRVPVASLMLREGMGDPPAMIGQDVLRGTVVAVGPDPSTPVFWQVGDV